MDTIILGGIMASPIITALLSALGSAGGSALGGLFSNDPKETRTQGQQRKLVDELMASLFGQGEFSDLFNADENTFQKSFVDPAKARFQSQTAPQIQQSFISSGQQRGTGLDDTLTRAGVDMDQLLNEQFAQFQQSAQNRKFGAISSILGLGEGVQPGQSTGEKLSGGASGFFAGKAFPGSIDKILDAISQSEGKPKATTSTDREGFKG